MAKYFDSGLTSASGQRMDSCLRCGRMRDAHEVKVPRVSIGWGGLHFDFDNAAAARNAGFQLEDVGAISNG